MQSVRKCLKNLGVLNKVTHFLPETVVYVSAV